MDSRKVVWDFWRGVNCNPQIKADVKLLIEGKVIPIPDVSVFITEIKMYNYIHVEIMWDEAGYSEDEYHNLGLHGYYSANFVKMNKVGRSLEIYDNGIVISIFPN